MKIALLTMGTFGDVRPFLALAYGLEERGHEVALAGPENFLDYVTNTYRRAYVPIGLNSQQVLESEQGRKWMASGDAKKFLDEMSRISHENRHTLERDAEAACADCDVIIVHPLQLYYGCILSEKWSKPVLIANTFPFAPATQAFPHFLATVRKLPVGFLNKMTHRMVASMYDKSLRADMNEWRAKLGLAPLRGVLYTKLEKQKVPFLQAFSPELVAPPKDWDDDAVIVTGQWKIPQQYEPEREKAELDPELAAWLDEGAPPIYFGFGSLPVLEPQKMIDMAVNVAEVLQTRAIIASGWTQIDDGHSLPASVRMIRSANHEKLFPRCSLIVHHGGAGTTHTAVESGVPSIICSTYADQPFWGERIAALGIGGHIPFPKLNRERLLPCIRRLQTPEVRAKAAEIGRRVRRENGLQTALDWLESHLSAAPAYHN